MTLELNTKDLEKNYYMFNFSSLKTGDLPKKRLVKQIILIIIIGLDKALRLNRKVIFF